MFFLSYNMLKISTRQDRQLRMCRSCHATLGTRFQVCLFQVYFVGHFFRPDDFLYVWKGDVLGGLVLVEEHYIVCFQIIGSLAPNIAECFPPRADWFYEFIDTSLRMATNAFFRPWNKDCLNPPKTGCFLYLFWFIVCLKSLFELRENWTYL